MLWVNSLSLSSMLFWKFSLCVWVKALWARYASRSIMYKVISIHTLHLSSHPRQIFSCVKNTYSKFGFFLYILYWLSVISMCDQVNWQLLCKRLCVEMFMENKDTLLRIITLCSSLLRGKIEYNCFGFYLEYVSDHRVVTS